MVFHGCSSQCENWMNHKVFLAESEDGKTFSLVKGWEPFAGSVPAVYRRGNTIFIYTGDSSVRKIDMNSGQVQFAGKVALNADSASDKTGFVDPTIEQGNDGRFVMFYLPGAGAGKEPAGCNGESSCTKEIRYAVEEPGSGGMRFQYKGIAVTKNLTGTGTLSDPDIFNDGSKWVLLVSEGPSVEAFTSSTLEGKYSSAGVISSNSGGIPAGFHDGQSGSNWIYTTKENSSGQFIRRSVSKNGTDLLSSFETVIDASIYKTENLTTIASPSFRRNNSGAPCPTCSPTGQSSTSPSPSAASSSPEPTPSATPLVPVNSPSPSPSPIVSSAKPQPSPSVTKKIISITCIKGKVKKVVTGTNPVCPSGYKKV